MKVRNTYVNIMNSITGIRNISLQAMKRNNCSELFVTLLQRLRKNGMDCGPNS